VKVQQRIAVLFNGRAFMIVLFLEVGTHSLLNLYLKQKISKSLEYQDAGLKMIFYEPIIPRGLDNKGTYNSLTLSRRCI